MPVDLHMSAHGQAHAAFVTAGSHTQSLDSHFPAQFQRAEQCGDTVSGLHELAKRCPSIFTRPPILKLLLDILKWQSPPPREGHFQHHLAASLFMAGFGDVEMVRLCRCDKHDRLAQENDATWPMSNDQRTRPCKDSLSFPSRNQILSFGFATCLLVRGRNSRIKQVFCVFPMWYSSSCSPL